MNAYDIINSYTKGAMSLEDANKELFSIDAGFHLEPGKNEFTADDLLNVHVGETPAEANGYGLLDTGTGVMEKVKVTAGKLDYAVNEIRDDGTANMPAFVFIGGKCYAALGDTLVER